MNVKLFVSLCGLLWQSCGSEQNWASHSEKTIRQAAESLRETGICTRQEHFQARGLLDRTVFDLRRSALIRTGRGQADVAPRFEQGPSRKLICYFGQGQWRLMCIGGKISCYGVLTVPDIYINKSSNVDQQQQHEEWISTPSCLERYRIGQSPHCGNLCPSLACRIKWKDRAGPG